MKRILSKCVTRLVSSRLLLSFATCSAISAAGCEDNEDVKAGADASVDTAKASPSAGADGSVKLAFTPTWSEHIAPMVSQHCSSCHKQNGIAPFSMQSYESAKAFAKSMAAAVERGSMPPFLAQETPECTPKNKYANDTRLSAEQKALLRAWADADAPEGDKSKAAPLPPPPVTALAREDVVVTLPTPIVVEKNAKGDIHTCVPVDLGLTKDVYVSGRQITSGNDKVLHHVVTYVVKPAKTDGTKVTKAEMAAAFKAAKGVGIGERYDCFGGPNIQDTGLQFELLGAWAPGAQPTTGPDDSGQPLAADSLAVLDIHYHPLASGPETDSKTKLSLMLTDGIPSLVARPLLIGNFVTHNESPFGVSDLIKQPDEQIAEFKIPAGAKNHVEEMTFKWKLLQSPLRIYFSGTHMHYVGRDMTVTLENTKPQAGEDAKECLVQTPKWDFNWQGGYGYDTTYDKLPVLNDGDVLRMRCTYDNTRDNNFLANALDEQGKANPVDVVLGEDTLDEMCLASIGLAYPNAAKYAVGDAGTPAADAGAAVDAGVGMDAGGSITLGDASAP